ncbi:AP-4 complex subunit beta-1 [Entomortierella chlamydospora]|uniref:AP-4 complex subunit beta-1 n=1 Tax=Entomortierella chlamydospora TaxID=101097 RepID=A0A9P6N232_9FUNG|nr:AP-4 complex subunit beta-1 [Entomortierella chlamydospora]
MDVAELSEAFKDQSLQPSNHAQLMQRMQELMGQGMDVSSLFATIVSSTSTRDISVKKAAYAFLAKYGSTNEELCFLSINTLHQDCADLDPIVRSLALRTICSLGQRSVLRFMLQPLSKGFQDKNAHVRKTAAMACISIFELDPVFVLESEIVDKLYGLLRDRETQVVVSAILALETILVDEGGIVINYNIAAHFLQRYKDWSPSQLQIILGVLCRYKPQTNDEIYEIMNDVDDGLQNPSLAVQMATLRLFIWLCQDLTEIQEDLQKTIEETLIKHLGSPVPDLVYASLCHLSLMIETTGRLHHNTPEHLSAVLCKLNDPVAIKLQKFSLCATIAQKSTSVTVATTLGSTNVSTLILDHLCHVAAMRDIVNLVQKSHRTKTRIDRHSITDNLEVACRAIETIGKIGTFQHSSQSQEKQPMARLSPTSGSQEDGQSGRSISKSCIDRLFQLLILFSSMEHTLEKPRSEGQKDGSSNMKKSQHGQADNSWTHTNIADLGLDESQVALLLSTVLLTIESCWQYELEARQRRTEETARMGGIFEPLQIKSLGILLLRHLDQGELDRLAKKKKPLRFRYDDGNDDQPSQASSVYAHNGSPGDISRLARISGLRMLLLEESAQQLSLRKQIQINSSNPEDEGAKTKAQGIQEALGMRAQYALLLQQQVQDMVQSLDTTITHTTKSDQAFLLTRAEQIATLQLACHLVAFSIDQESEDAGMSTEIQSTDVDILKRRLDILGQAVDQLIPANTAPGSESENSPFGDDLVSFETVNPSTTSQQHDSQIRVQLESVSRDVADRARLVESLFLVPLLSSLASPSTLTDIPTPRSISQNNQFNSPIFKTDAYQKLVKQKFVDQFGIKGKRSPFATATVENGAESDAGLDMDKLILYDWCFQVGFNTLALTK